MKTNPTKRQSGIRWQVWLWWFASVGYMGLIFFLSAKQGKDIRLYAPDYIMHGLGYAGLSFLLFNALRFSPFKGNPHVFAVLLSVAYGLTDELHQSTVPGRDPSLSDIAADTVGAIGMQIALWLFIWVIRKARISQSRS